MRKKLEIQPGMKFNRLTIVKEVEPHRYPTGIPRRRYLCKCECGNEINVLIHHLKKNTKSCGCLRVEISKSLIGDLASNFKHGLRKTPEYEIWRAMKQRCLNPKHKSWKNYGGRGIKICDRWLNSVENFFEDMGKRPNSDYSIDRINNDGNYEPSNCKWATPTEQNNNRRIYKKIECQI
jgi:hypothetical protein